MTSVAKVEANKRNAQKSTGPRTAAGKERARMNGLKHGLRAEEAVLPTESRAAFDDHMAAWADDWRPASVTRRHFVERAGLAAWRLKRCARVETERLSERAFKAGVLWDHRRAGWLDRLVDKLDETPIEATAALERTRGGVDRLIATWERLIASAEDVDGWDDFDAHHHRFVLLRTGEAEVSDEDDDVRIHSWQLLIHARPDLAPATDDDGAEFLPIEEAEAAEARHQVTRACRVRLSELSRLWRSLPDDAIERDRHAEMVAFEPHPEDAPFQRYEARHDREARAAVATLIALHRSGADLADEAEDDAPPALTPEPATATELPPGLPTEPNPPAAPSRPSAGPATEGERIGSETTARQSDRDRDGRSWPAPGEPRPSDWGLSGPLDQ